MSLRFVSGKRAGPPGARVWLGDSEMAGRVLDFDWAATSLGALQEWPQSLKTSVAACLHSGFQMAIYWGPELLCLYNDAERTVLGGLHPRALGMPARELLADSWDVLEPQLRGVTERGETATAHDQPLHFNRSGRLELGYFTYSYSALPGDEGGIGGVLLVSEETTRRVLAERRIEALRRMATKSMDAATGAEACLGATQALDGHADVPFLLVHLIEGDRAVRVAATRLPGDTEAPAVIALGRDSPDTAGPALHALRQAGRPGEELGAELFLAAPRGDALPRRAFVVPIATGTADAVDGFVIAGLNDELPFDDAYRWFLMLVALGVGRSITAARAREAERERTRAIAAFETARTRFFNDVSHELRTPLALIIASLEELVGAGLGVRPAGSLAVARRSATRMLRLVNGLLDFSRIEAGEALGERRPTDLARLTRDIAAMFHSTAQRAGVALTVDCPPLPAPVSVDAEAWERIVSNLVSNALKFTPRGEIRVHLGAEDGCAVLSVADTGVGIAPDDLEAVFRRFGRVIRPGARTSEGSGIGLALVRELAELHRGSVAAESRPGAGTRITVRLPLEHVDAPAGEPRAAAGSVAAPFVAEAEGWLDDEPAPGAPAAGGAHRDRAVVVEDQPDMCAYLRRLLAPEYAVETAADGRRGLELILARPPAIVISDVMLPGLDGLGLLRALRSDARTRDTPVVLVSARADAQTSLQAFELGADDYIVKPFGTRELMARVRATVHSARLRTGAGEARGRAQERAARERELQLLLEDLKKAQRRVAEAGDAERRRIERDLHDGAQQRLMAVRLELGLLGERLDEDGRLGLRATLDGLRRDVEDALDELRELAHGLVPPLLASDGLYTALAAAARRTHVPARIGAADIGRLPPAVENAAYFCCAEALQNVTKHAGPGARVALDLRVRDGALEFRVADDGAGFDPATASGGNGLTNLRDRLGALGGHAEIDSAPGRGTVVRGQIPLP